MYNLAGRNNEVELVEFRRNKTFENELLNFIYNNPTKLMTIKKIHVTLVTQD